MNVREFTTALNPYFPSGQVSLAIFIIGIFATAGNIIGIKLYERPGLRDDKSKIGRPIQFWLLWFYAIMFILITLCSMYGLYHNYFGKKIVS